jgi:tetratricopeptide (TPR) repeat protein
LLAEVEERSGDFLGAGNEYRRAAQMDPSEQNLFDWGCELLLHQSVEPSIDAFKGGIVRYSGSPKLWIGLGVALYSQGRYDDAISALLRATDLNPSDPRPYLFLGKAYNISTKEADTVADRLKRFAEIEPDNAQAIYYYAVSLWKGKREDNLQAGSDQVEALLKRSACLDPAFPDAHLQLGILYAGQQKYSEAIGQYQKAIQLDPDMADAHYRLGQAYLRAGQKEQAQQEFELYARLRKAQIADDEKYSQEVLRSVQTPREHSPSSP